MLLHILFDQRHGLRRLEIRWQTDRGMRRRRNLSRKIGDLGLAAAVVEKAPDRSAASAIKRLPTGERVSDSNPRQGRQRSDNQQGRRPHIDKVRKSGAPCRGK